MAACDETCSTHGCNQSAGCAAHAYKAHFDHLGQPVDQTPPWHAADLMVIAFSVICLAGMVAGIFQ
jgi:hypothetical protein